MPLFMLWKECRAADGEVDFAKIKLILDWPCRLGCRWE
jgi:hypothetical protein